MFKISQAAKMDLLEIALYGDTHFGQQKSNDYAVTLQKRFEQIAGSPLLYPQVDHIREGYRRSVCGAHSIYYRIAFDTIEIMRVIRSQNFNKTHS